MFLDEKFKEVTVADYLVFAYLRDNAVWNSEKKDEFTNLIRWFGHIGSKKSVFVCLHLVLVFSMLFTCDAVYFVLRCYLFV